MCGGDWRPGDPATHPPQAEWAANAKYNVIEHYYQEWYKFQVAPEIGDTLETSWNGAIRIQERRRMHARRCWVRDCISPVEWDTSIVPNGVYLIQFSPSCLMAAPRRNDFPDICNIPERLLWSVPSWCRRRAIITGIFDIERIKGVRNAEDKFRCCEGSNRLVKYNLITWINDILVIFICMHTAVSWARLNINKYG